jgi:orotidine-5'-phosphate decarboxylase
MTRQRLIEEIFKKQTYLCVGLDTDAEKIPSHLNHEPDPVLAFNRAIIEATLPYTVAYKLNTAFYEVRGEDGWRTLRHTIESIPRSCFIIADAKRGDIGNTSARYARAFFENLQTDAVTVVPYMGEDSVRPFMHYSEKWVILLALTSNPGNADFQLMESKVSGRKLYEEVLLKATTWAGPEQLMFVVGATQSGELHHIRKLVPDYFLLVPGIGAQGGDLEEVSRNGLTPDCGLLVNVSRSIIYASSGTDFAEAAGREARSLQRQMARHLSRLR